MILFLYISLLFSPPNIKAPVQQKQVEVVQDTVKKKLYFILHGLNDSPVPNAAAFEKKYNVGFTVQTGALDPGTYNRTRIHNQKIIEYLDLHFPNEAWREELPATPFGVLVED